MLPFTKKRSSSKTICGGGESIQFYYVHAGTREAGLKPGERAFLVAKRRECAQKENVVNDCICYQEKTEVSDITGCQ